MIVIKPRIPKDCSVTLPGSKSYTHRMLIAAALAKGTSKLKDGLDSEDIDHTRTALSCMGISINGTPDCLVVSGGAGRMSPYSPEIHLGNSGTSMRLLTAVAALGQGPYVLTGTGRMQERPIDDLVLGLTQLGVHATCLKGNGCPPVEIRGNHPEGGSVDLKCGTSSQFLSAVLLISPYLKNGSDIHVVEGPVSKPYIDITVDVMNRFGVSVEREAYHRFRVKGEQCYRAVDISVPPDASQAGYFWAAGAITGAAVTVRGIGRESLQGDAGFTKVLADMGCRVALTDDGLTVKGGGLRGISVDMGNMPDLVPTLAVVAAFAHGATQITNISHLRAKESDRIRTTATELKKMGIRVEEAPSALTVWGGPAVGADIDTYDDHRIAMSFAVAGLRVPGVRIKDEHCVSKSFPKFWEVFESLE
jgi:3-phosphoshikimate 1-carboxyvinyltransferase